MNRSDAMPKMDSMPKLPLQFNGADIIDANGVVIASAHPAGDASDPHDRCEMCKWLVMQVNIVPTLAVAGAKLAEAVKSAKPHCPTGIQESLDDAISEAMNP